MDVPLAISALVPEGANELPNQAQSFTGNQVESFQPLMAYIRDCVIVASVSVLTIGAIFISSVLSRLFCIGGILLELNMESMMTINFVLGLVCCIPLSIAMAIIYVLRIKVDLGEVSRLCLAALCFAIIITLITALAPAFRVTRKRRDFDSEVVRIPK